MFRIAVIALIAGAAYDQYFLNGYYTRAVEAVARAMMHHIVRAAVAILPALPISLLLRRPIGMT